MVPSWDREGFEFIRYTDLCDAPYQDPQGTHYFQYLVANGLADRYEEGSPLPERRCVLDGSKPANLPYEHSIERFTGNSALEFLGRRDKQRPFFMHLSFQRPHAPIAPSREHFDLYDPDAIDLPENADDYFSRRFEGKPEFMRDALRDGCEYPLADPDKGRLRRCLASYYALITAIDGEIGRVLDDLERTGELANTVIVYTADHGDFAGEHGLFHKNFGIYDSIQKIPFLLSFPGSPCGTACDALIESVDLFPTLCELCGVETPSDIDGSSLVPVLNGNAPEKDAVYCEWDSFYHRRKIAAIRTRQHRLVFYGGVDGGELYDHDQDPGEAINLWDHHGLQPLRRSLTDRLFSFCMNYRVKTDYTLDMILDNQYANTPTLLLHRHGKKWSDLNTIFKI
jgi:arylsulfatase A-like enzyme